MGRLLLPNQDFHAKRMKSVTMELLKGKEIATRLQALLRNRDHTSDDLGLDSARQLTRQILRIFTGTISELSSSEIAQIPSVDRAVKKASPAAGVKERRGCYKRRRTSDSWVTVSHTQEDGFVWRKYGQKVIMNSKHPRCYFRCTYKPEGCKATKQVQRTKDDDYQTTYYNHHTCTKTPQVLVVDSAGSMELMDPNLISFQSSENTPHQDPYSPNPMSTDVSSQLVQQEGNARLSNQDLSSNEVKSTPEWVSSYCFDKTSLHMLDMDVNELGDIDYNSLYFD